MSHFDLGYGDFGYQIKNISVQQSCNEKPSQEEAVQQLHDAMVVHQRLLTLARRLYQPQCQCKRTICKDIIKHVFFLLFVFLCVSRAICAAVQSLHGTSGVAAEEEEEKETFT
jgi:hypothetical protein